MYYIQSIHYTYYIITYTNEPKETYCVTKTDRQSSFHFIQHCILLMVGWLVVHTYIHSFVRFWYDNFLGCKKIENHKRPNEIVIHSTHFISASQYASFQSFWPMHSHPPNRFSHKSVYLFRLLLVKLCPCGLYDGGYGFMIALHSLIPPPKSLQVFLFFSFVIVVCICLSNANHVCLTMGYCTRDNNGSGGTLSMECPWRMLNGNVMDLPCVDDVYQNKAIQ